MNKEQPGRYRWAKVRVGVGSGLIIRTWATGSKIHIISFPIVFKLFFITDQGGGGISGEVRCCRRVVRTWPETRGQNISKADFDSTSPHMEPSTFTGCPLFEAVTHLCAKALKCSMYLMCRWQSALSDKSMTIYDQGTCVTSLDQHKPFCFKEHTLMILSHHFHVRTTWGFLLWKQEPCRQLWNAWDSERNMYKTEAVTLIHNQSFPVIQIHPLPQPRNSSHSSLCGQKETSAHHLPESH